LVLLFALFRPLRTSWLTVGNEPPEKSLIAQQRLTGPTGTANRTTDGSETPEAPQTREPAWLRGVHALASSPELRRNLGFLALKL
jgi:hypothetical protein